ncbi:hypothetical protein [Azorhizobium doebereinerae]|uniref:hypothetical protein n=1 Tax=Azorhizobium doebereinerae TaxID=281091 RepID=UPI0003F8148D|nr:hypothetical protein [Azorhizobium doebereinerae]
MTGVIDKVEVLDIRDGDTLVLGVRDRIDAAAEERLQRELKVFLRKRGLAVEVLVLTDGISLSVLREAAGRT